ncbi:MAG: choline-sulfatase [Rhodobacteraceae bacterium]|nr:choline-sulfatase [Paracoccaceae bacterium]
MSARPNILIILVDQLTGTLFPDGPAPFLHTPNLRRLADHALRFQNCYTASPLAAPAQATILSGQLPRRTRVYDNAAGFASDIPTYAHHLRRAGYYTAVSGRLHGIGPNPSHGFEDRLTGDTDPAECRWPPDYRKPVGRGDCWYHSLASVAYAGVTDIANPCDHNDTVALHAVQKLTSLLRGGDPRPWCLTVSFSQPKNPFVAHRTYWDLYDGAPEREPPEAIVPDAQDPHSQRLMAACDRQSFDITPDHVRRARQAYFANLSHVDALIGEVFSVLDATGQDAIVIFLSDQGQMLGDRGLWFAMNFFDPAARVPLMISAPDLPPGLVTAPVSTVDVTPTVAALAGVTISEVMPWTDGVNLLPMARGGTGSMVAMEYAGEASLGPMVALREGAWKYIRCAADPELLFDLASDPGERTNLVDDSRAALILDHFRKAADARWDLPRFDAEVRESQARRRVVHEALHSGAPLA